MKAYILAGLIVAVSATAVHAQPRHIYRDGNYFFCPDPDFDPYCRLPNDYGRPRDVPSPIPEGRPGPPVLVVPGLPPALAAEADRAIRNAMRPRYRPPEPPQPAPNVARSAPPPPPPPQMSMEESRADVVRRGQAHCDRWPQDRICHWQQERRQ